MSVDLENLEFYRLKLESCESAEAEGRMTDRAELEKTIRLCRRRIKDIESRPTFEPQCHTLAPGPPLKPGWASIENEERLR